MNRIIALDISANNQSPATGRSVYNLQMAYENGYKILIIKSTEGYAYLNPHYLDWIKLAHKIGFVLGAYHYWLPLEGSGVDKQAAWFMDKGVKPLADLTGGVMLPAWVDVEVKTSASLQLKKASFLAMMNAIVDEKISPGIYTSKNKWREIFGAPSWGNNNNYYYWIAHYLDVGTNVWNFLYPEEWDRERILLHQYGIAANPKHKWTPGLIPGISGQVDINYWMYDEQTLNDIVGRETTPVPPPGPKPQPEVPPTTLDATAMVTVNAYGKIYTGKTTGMLRRLDD